MSIGVYRCISIWLCIVIFFSGCDEPDPTVNYKESADKFVQTLIESIFSSWSEASFDSVAALELKLLIDKDAFSKEITRFASLYGAYQNTLSFEGELFVVNSPIGAHVSQTITGNYVVLCKYEKAKIALFLGIIREDGEWKMTGYNIAVADK